MKKRLLLALVPVVLATGCSVEGRKVGGCVVHQSVGMSAGVAWADCPVVAGRVYIPGQATGYGQPIAQVVGDAAIGGGIATGAALLKVPSSFTLTPPK